MRFELSAAAEDLREEIRAALAAEWAPGRLGYRRKESEDVYSEMKSFRQRIARHGWFGFGIPEAYGGRGGSLEERYVVAAEFAYFAAPYPKIAMNMIAPMLLRNGSEEMKAKYLPWVASGALEFAQAYSEPDAGSDLASLRTAASYEDGSYVINGQKLYSSLFHRSEFCVVAVRTDTSAPKHRGISLLIVDVETPGIEVRPLWAMGDLRTNVVFFDNVVVPAENLVGQLNSGWDYIRTTLGFERLIAFSINEIRALFDDLLDYLLASGLESDPVVRLSMAQFATEMEVLDTLTLRALWTLEREGQISYEGNQLKVIASELKQRIGHGGLQLIGHAAQATDALAPLEGALMRSCEAALMHSFGGGANEIQRDIIANRGLGLGRTR